MEKLLKPTKAIFDAMIRIIAEGNEQYESMGCVNPETVSEYEELMGIYDFESEVFTAEDGHKGLKWCFGDVMIPANYDDVAYYSNFMPSIENHFAIASREGRWYLINHEGKEIFCADLILPDSGGIVPARFRHNDKWGLVNSRGEIILQAIYDSLDCEDNGFRFFSQNGKKGFIDPYGKYFEAKFDDIELDEEDYLFVTLNGQKGYLDENGDFTLEKEEAFYSMQLILTEFDDADLIE